MRPIRPVSATSHYSPAASTTRDSPAALARYRDVAFAVGWSRARCSPCRLCAPVRNGKIAQKKGPRHERGANWVQKKTPPQGRGLGAPRGCRIGVLERLRADVDRTDRSLIRHVATGSIAAGTGAGAGVRMGVGLGAAGAPLRGPGIGPGAGSGTAAGSRIATGLAALLDAC
jgi:hypothetical protein